MFVTREMEGEAEMDSKTESAITGDIISMLEEFLWEKGAEIDRSEERGIGEWNGGSRYAAVLDDEDYGELSGMILKILRKHSFAENEKEKKHEQD